MAAPRGQPAVAPGLVAKLEWMTGPRFAAEMTGHVARTFRVARAPPTNTCAWSGERAAGVDLWTGELRRVGTISGICSTVALAGIS